MAAKHYDGQIGAEATPGEYLEALWRCTREWMRVLKPEGSMFVDLGDKYSLPGKGERNMQGPTGGIVHKVGAAQANRSARDFSYDGTPAKSLLLLPERYRIGCVDRLSLLAREVIEWHKRIRCRIVLTTGAGVPTRTSFISSSRDATYAAVGRDPRAAQREHQPRLVAQRANRSGNGTRHRTFRR